MRTVFLTALVVIAVDQASKYAVIHGLRLWRVREIEILPPLLNFRYGENTGINFGLGDGIGPGILIAIALLICAAVLLWLRRRPQPRLALIGAGLLIGGALGNVIDRILYGYVLDFLNMSCCGIDNPFVFNLADVFIFLGALLLVFYSDDGKASEEKRA